MEPPKQTVPEEKDGFLLWIFFHFTKVPPKDNPQDFMMQRGLKYNNRVDLGVEFNKRTSPPSVNLEKNCWKPQCDMQNNLKMQVKCSKKL